jgi:hypothetical protein
MTLDDVTRPDAATYGRILELSIRGARHPDTVRATRRWRRTFGKVTLSLYEQTPVRVATDFYARLGEAAVSEARRPCTWEPGHAFHDCGPGWKAVRRIRAEIGFTPRRCVLVLPQDGPARELTYPAAALGERIVVYTGLNNYDPRYRARRALWEHRTFRPSRFNPMKKPPPRVESVPVFLDVAIDGRPAARLAHPVEDEGWRRHVIPVPSSAATGAVRFSVSTRHAWGKHFCFHARAEGGRP